MRAITAVQTYLFLIITAINAIAAEQITPEGFWRHPANGSVAQIYNCGDGIWDALLCGRIVETSDAQKLDDRNPHENLRNRSVVGIMILGGAEKYGQGIWKGPMYNRADGKVYAVSLRLTDSESLTVSDSCGTANCKSIRWLRVRNYLVQQSLGPPPMPVVNQPTSRKPTPACRGLIKSRCENAAGCAWAKGTPHVHGFCVGAKT
jgi:uncharacterized protein (DUF2147 family)